MRNFAPAHRATKLVESRAFILAEPIETAVDPNSPSGQSLPRLCSRGPNQLFIGRREFLWERLTARDKQRRFALQFSIYGKRLAFKPRVVPHLLRKNGFARLRLRPRRIVFDYPAAEDLTLVGHSLKRNHLPIVAG